MNQPTEGRFSTPVRRAIEIAVNLGLVILVVIWCLQILDPFISLMLWGAVIAISIHKLFRQLEGKLGGRRKLALTLIVGAGLAAILVPAWMFAGSTLDSVQNFVASVEAGTFEVNPPNESVKDWPLVGEKIYSAWNSAAFDFENFLETYHEQLKGIASTAATRAAGMFMSILAFVLALIVAAIFLANAEAVEAAMRRFCRRLVGDQGDEMLDLTVATVRSVTVGVIGIAFIQAVGTGAGMFIVGVPMAGILALLVLILVIAQLPALIVMLPAIIYVFSIESTTTAVIFAIWSILVSMSDMVLKPLLLGRGVAAPMLVILLGAIGGMIMSGILGLFVGAVVLAVGYKLFMAWLAMGEGTPQEAASQE